MTAAGREDNRLSTDRVEKLGASLLKSGAKKEEINTRGVVGSVRCV